MQYVAVRCVQSWLSEVHYLANQFMTFFSVVLSQAVQSLSGAAQI